MSFYGMDTAAGEDFASLLHARQGALTERAEALAGTINGIDAFWRGTDAEVFRSDWTGLRSGLIDGTVERLAELGQEMQRHIEEQEGASGTGDAGSWSDFDLGDVFPIGDFPGIDVVPDSWQELTGLGISGLNQAAQYGAGSMRNNAWRAFARGGEEAVVPVLRNAHYLERAGKALGPIGHGFTAITSGWERWQQDADDPSLSGAERVARTGVDAGANVAGAAAGAKGGFAAGAAIGSVVPGVGTAIGGAVGAVAGGIIGGGVADAAVDWLLG